MKNLTRREAVKAGAAIAAVGATATLGLHTAAKAATSDAYARWQDRQLLTAYRRMSPVRQQVFLEMVDKIKNDPAPDKDVWLAWMHKREAELAGGAS